MYLNSSELSQIVKELSPLLMGQRLQKIREHPQHGLSFSFQRDTLMLYQCPQYQALFLTELRPPSHEPQGWVMLLRKYIQGHPLLALKQLNQDRILAFEFYQATLIFELLGRHPKTHLISPDGIVIHSPQSPQLTNKKYHPPKLNPKYKSQTLEIGSHLSYHALIQEKFKRFIWLKSAWNQLTHTRRLLEKTHQHIEQRLAGLESAEKEARYERYQLYGELLQGAYGKVKKGAKAVEVNNYYTQSPLLIPLDPKLDLKSNITFYYEKAKKAKRTLEYNLATRPTWEEKWLLIDDLLPTFKAGHTEFSVKMADHPLDALKGLYDRIMGALPNDLRVTAPKPKSIPKAQNTQKKPYRLFISAEGKEIWVGKKAKDNDLLSFKLARGNDLWLHLKEQPGSHVLVRLNKKEPLTQDTLLDAATLALHFSTNKEESADIIYTYAKYVKKPKKSKPGQVLLSEFKTLFIRQETERLNRLLGKTQG